MAALVVVADDAPHVTAEPHCTFGLPATTAVPRAPALLASGILEKFAPVIELSDDEDGGAAPAALAAKPSLSASARAARRLRASLAPAVATPASFVDADAALALQLQREEEERAAKRRRQEPMQPQLLLQQRQRAPEHMLPEAQLASAPVEPEHPPLCGDACALLRRCIEGAGDRQRSEFYVSGPTPFFHQHRRRGRRGSVASNVSDFFLRSSGGSSSSAKAGGGAEAAGCDAGTSEARSAFGADAVGSACGAGAGGADAHGGAGAVEARAASTGTGADARVDAGASTAASVGASFGAGGGSYVAAEAATDTWSCGYRNVQMLIGHLLANGRPHLFGGRVPNVHSLQVELERLWSMGYDPEGRQQLGGFVRGTRKWIGTSEACVLLRGQGVRCNIVAFRGSAADGADDAAASAAGAVVERALRHFRGMGDKLAGAATRQPPLYLQHDGHSRTVVGVQRRTEPGGGITDFLLVLDPGLGEQGFRDFAAAAERGRGWERFVKRSLAPLRRKAEYELLVVEEGSIAPELVLASQCVARWV
eukprot:TRINITY_DN54005_c0_g1_i1.p1 TRINITY_DN54005_c0_g1~~TRINITY_DN54005_c0_g1_i1.p1  ORF type:complete len:562 (-),score=148.18 TRINITY_DN54005_c0_g1_i1:40-1650(-)